MSVKAKIEKQPDGGFAVVFEEDGSGYSRDYGQTVRGVCE